jgi:hypothetical protein
VTLRWFLLVLLVLATPVSIVMPDCARAAEPAAGQHEAGQQHGQRKQPEKGKVPSGSCLGCVAPSTATPPMIEAPNRALMMIPAGWYKTAATLPPARPATPPPKHA